MKPFGRENESIMVNTKNLKIRQTMYEILIGRRTLKETDKIIGGGGKEKCAIFEDLGLCATREYGEKYVTTRLGSRTLWVAWLRVDYNGLDRVLNLKRGQGSRSNKVKEFDDFMKERYESGDEYSIKRYVGWVFGDSKERDYSDLVNASKDLSERATTPLLARLREEKNSARGMTF